MRLRDLTKISKIRKLKFVPIDLDDTDIGGGIYRMFDKSGEVIYVGKSMNLHKRLKQHIGKDTHTTYFIDEVTKFEWFTEPDPVFQNLLEGVFIAFHKPKYNEEVKEAKERFGEDYGQVKSE